nr:hypothetical protein [Bacillota bacterium]
MISFHKTKINRTSPDNSYAFSFELQDNFSSNISLILLPHAGKRKIRATPARRNASPIQGAGTATAENKACPAKGRLIRSEGKNGEDQGLSFR